MCAQKFLVDEKNLSTISLRALSQSRSCIGLAAVVDKYQILSLCTALRLAGTGVPPKCFIYSPTYIRIVGFQ